MKRKNFNKSQLIAIFVLICFVLILIYKYSNINPHRLDLKSIVTVNNYESRNVFKQNIRTNDTTNTTTKLCAMYNCFDYSKCSLRLPFKLFIYDYKHHIESDKSRTEYKIVSSIESTQITNDPNNACIFIVILTELVIQKNISEFLNSLKYWSKGQNHIIINTNIAVDLQLRDIENALLVQSMNYMQHFRHNFDIIAPDITTRDDRDQQCANVMLHHVQQKYLLSLQQSYPTIETLMTFISKQDLIKDLKTNPVFGEISADIDKQSIFALILPPIDTQLMSHNNIFDRLRQIISCGAVPILIGGDYLKLAFHELIDWRRAVIHLPIARVDDIMFVVKSFTEEDIVQMRIQGRMLFERYLSTNEAIIQTVLHVLRSRLSISAAEVRDTPTINVYNESTKMNRFSVKKLKTDEYLGPIEESVSSVNYSRKVSQTFVNQYELWNSEKLNPFSIFPATPFDPISTMDTNGKFRSLSAVSGLSFKSSLSGNYDGEQFTIVMLTYKREFFLPTVLSRFHNLPHLNKVVIIWNSIDTEPSPNMSWPIINAPIIVVRPKANSLNNRFLPYDCIETDAIFTMDDDTNATNDEIILSFRVWRQSRDRLVGIPARTHKWDDEHREWSYLMDPSCEISMILTAAAFYHRYYNYMYTYWMPKSIRDKVDEITNCEDIAMNFLVSHLSRKPPIKVGIKYNFGYPQFYGEGKGLSWLPNHAAERSYCVNFFVKVFGYMPLLYSQYRADSILYNTNMNSNQKCYSNL